MLRMREGLFTTERCRVPGEPLDVRAAAEAERVIALALEVAREFPVEQFSVG
jgi:hypothetical protein